MAGRPRFRLRVPDAVAALIRGMHPSLKRRIRAALDEILADPSAGKALKEELAGLRSYRVSRFRIVYRVSKGKTVELVAVGPRESIYEETYRLVSGKTTA